MTPDTVNNEKELLARLANGDQDAFASIVNEYSNKVFSHALSYLKTYQDAEEIVQDVFLKVWQGRDRLPEVKDFKSYLFILSRNQLVSAIRRKVLDTEDAFEGLAETALQPDKQYQSKEIYRRIMDGVDKLSPQQKSVFTLSRINNFSHEEISSQLGISKRTVKFHLVLALNFMREFLHEKD